MYYKIRFCVPQNCMYFYKVIDINDSGLTGDIGILVRENF